MTRAARRVYGSGSASRGRRGAGAPGVLRLLRGYAFAIAGIAIGVAGVVALSAMSERIVRFIEGGDRFVLGQISVAGRGMGMGAGFTAGGLLPAATIKKISSVPGVAGVQPQVMLPLDPSTSQFMTLTQGLILGLDLSVPMPNPYHRPLPVPARRFLPTGHRPAAVVGAPFAAPRGLGVLALVIGGLSLANTMAAAVFERIRDFGVKRALGATDLDLAREVLGEALAVTVCGGAGGLGLAVLLGSSIDAWAGRSGQQLFYFSTRLLTGALAFSVLLGAAAAAWATVRVVRLSPAEAIRRGA